MSDQTGMAGELNDAVDQLHDSLQHATEAAARIRMLLPKVTRIGAMFEELEAIFESGRQSLGAQAIGTPPSAARSQPTLVVAGAAPKRTPETPPRAATRQQVSEQLASEIETVPPEASPAPPSPPVQQPFDIPGIAANGEELISFRLEFESHPGPLDLRAVDDAVSEHYAVRDVALLDYDGRRATLKVWIVATASVAEVQQALADRAKRVMGSGGDVSIVALEDVA
jgi:hypothetical protein